jgi:hypothetical protein
MAFKALFLAHSPDADYEKHNSVIDTGRYRLLSYVVKNHAEAVRVAREVFEKEQIHCVVLCPGFTHKDIAEIFEALEGKVSVNVARGDNPSIKIAHEIIYKEFYQ